MMNLTDENWAPPGVSYGTWRTELQVRALLNFEEVPSKSEIERRARVLADLAKKSGYTEAWVSGPSVLVGPIITALSWVNVTPRFAISKTEVVYRWDHEVEQEVPRRTTRLVRWYHE